jgi:CHAD domain-containing protein
MQDWPFPFTLAEPCYNGVKIAQVFRKTEAAVPSRISLSTMVLASERCKWIFRKMDRDLLRVSSEPTPESVHDFRTSSRRLETLLQKLLPAADRNQKKLLKLLSRIRKRAGKIRDIDVQLAALRSFKVPQEPRRKSRLMHRLIEVRVQHERKLAKSLTKRRILEVRKRIKRSSKGLEITSGREPLFVAKEILSKITLTETFNDELLHRYRLAVKQARYAAEFAPKSVDSAQFIAGLKQLQDALGNWHDWMTLTHTATEHLGEVSQSSLVAALHNVTRIKFRHAVAAVSAAHTEFPRSTRTTRKPQRPSHPASARTQAA